MDMYESDLEEGISWMGGLEGKERIENQHHKSVY